MLRIGILTFHWAANHGAILQTYASYSYLKNELGVSDVKVIDYLPASREINFKNAIRPNYPRVIIGRLKALRKEKNLREFRSFLPLSDRYYTNKELIDSPPDVDLLITGSDQVWNPSYAMYGEGGPTPVYFLNFGTSNCKKVAMSVSFGCSEYPQNAYEIVKPYVSKFDKISVRENTGINILEKFGYEGAVVTADPTALIAREQYISLCGDSKSPSKYTATCFLRKKRRPIAKDIKRLLNRIGDPILNIEKKSMRDWLSGIRDAGMVVTDSFHCVMMCLKLHTPFVVVGVDGAMIGMNDRFYTLLDRFGLTHRIATSYDSIDLNEEFDWAKIDTCMENYALSLKEYLKSIID